MYPWSDRIYPSLEQLAASSNSFCCFMQPWLNWYEALIGKWESVNGELRKPGDLKVEGGQMRWKEDKNVHFSDSREHQKKKKGDQSFPTSRRDIPTSPSVRNVIRLETMTHGSVSGSPLSPNFLLLRHWHEVSCFGVTETTSVRR
ncbi:hypothetical protein RRG08_031089 [Elysia crispata]|uniref:Uncharacterized protein n=1 Tax=Elysia crispata TaxID=231223 RepID=A0AAE0ZH57_9GAST|nr:hypothetical protein RRG08_031089 [Elysia crispata]